MDIDFSTEVIGKAERIRAKRDLITRLKITSVLYGVTGLVLGIHLERYRAHSLAHNLPLAVELAMIAAVIFSLWKVTKAATRER